MKSQKGGLLKSFGAVDDAASLQHGIVASLGLRFRLLVQGVPMAEPDG